MKQTNRLAHGGNVDRSQPLEFTFNKATLTGYVGDTLASALLANDKHFVARSFKYHRPRGIVGAREEEPNALVQLESGAYTVPNARATQVELYAGLNASSVNCWPSLEWDAQALNGAVSRLLPAGFYYKTFKWPITGWELYERVIRRSAGLGVAPSQTDPSVYDKVNAHCDVLVVGSGPSGLLAALEAARSGARVIMAEQDADFGGSMLSTQGLLNDQPAAVWAGSVLDELRDCPEVSLLPRTTAVGYYDHNFVVLVERRHDHLPLEQRAGPRERLWRVRAKQVVLATGAIERPLVFPGNDRPGVMLASAARRYANHFAVLAGRRAVVTTNNDSAYAAVAELSDLGVEVVCMTDTRRDVRAEIIAPLRARGIEVRVESAVHNVAGRTRVRSVELGPADEAGTGRTDRHSCDLLLMSGGWNPTVHLHAQSGGRPVYCPAIAAFSPGASVQDEVSVGAAAGVFDLALAFKQAQCEIRERLRRLGLPVNVAGSAPAVTSDEGVGISAVWSLPINYSGTAKRFVDYQNDTTVSDIQLAVQEGYESVEHVKRYTALGFGTDQGKLGNINGLGIIANALGVDPGTMGPTTFRPMYSPVSFGTLAGLEAGTLFDPVRVTPIHPWHERAGAEFEVVGQWMRPHYYPRAGEDMRAAVNRETLATRRAAGILDATTLGKIDIQGRDALTMLERIYSNGWKTLDVGRCRYGFMLGEDGMVMDDGVTARLGEHHYHMTTTTGGAAAVLGWLERWHQTEWPELEVYFTSTTDQWSTLAIAGPKSRDIVSRMCGDIDFSPAAFPFMSWRDGTLPGGVPVRVFRISFSGELSFEINVPADYGLAAWELAMEVGAPFDLTPYGTEAMHVLRAEKGFVIVGQDTDGSVTPHDLGMDWIVSKSKDFVGKRSLARPDLVRSDRKQFVGLRTADPGIVVPEGAPVVEAPFTTLPTPMLGHVTSSYHSASLDRSIALAMVRGGQGKHGEQVYVWCGDGELVRATVCSPVFYDPEGVRHSE